MDPLFIGYLKQQALEAREIRHYLQKHKDVPEDIKNDMYSIDPLKEDKISNKKPLIGPEYQADCCLIH